MYFVLTCICLYAMIDQKAYVVAERRERSERSEANNRVLFEIPRYLYIYNINYIGYGIYYRPECIIGH